MEFREYGQIIWRRRRLITPLVVVTFVASLILNLVIPPIYRTEITVYLQAVIPAPIPGQTQYYPQDYWQTLYSEYLADDLGVIIKTQDFADKLARRIETRYAERVDVKDIIEALQTRKLHRALIITVTTGKEALTSHLAEATDDVLRTEGEAYFSRDGRQPVRLSVIDPPREPKAPSVIRRFLDVLLQAAVAFVAGVGLAFVLHYLDNRIQDVDDAGRTFGVPVLGAIPVDELDIATSAPPLMGVLGPLVSWMRGPDPEVRTRRSTRTPTSPQIAPGLTGSEVSGGLTSADPSRTNTPGTRRASGSSRVAAGSARP
jgi:capsular polysaccharide biosynthesis protein